MTAFPLQASSIQKDFLLPVAVQHFSAESFPTMRPIHWLYSHFAVGGWSPLQRLSGMLTAHMTEIAPYSGFTWHPHRGLEIYTWVLEGTISHEDSTGGKGDIGAGEIQRMFAGDWIEHQELNHTDKPVRVIQIWYVAERHHQGLEPHYQQVGREQLPLRRVGDASVYHLIGDGSPLEQHMVGRLSATTVPAGGSTILEAPRANEDLFLYVTDGKGNATFGDQAVDLGQYDVLVARPDGTAQINAAPHEALHFLNFYLPTFIHP